jgi:uncharacterized protein (TIGR02145 family)/uncharacterized repeat protein (TIGR02543 family)
MKRQKALIASLFGVVLFFIILCGLDPNTFDPSNPNYKKPSLIFDSLKVSIGDTVSFDSLLLVARGNTTENVFRWRIKKPNDTDTAWSAWTTRGTGIDTIKLTQLQPGTHVLNIQTAYHPNGDITDTILTFYKVKTPIIFALSDTLVKRAFAQSCTLWVKAVGTLPLSYRWFKDTGTIVPGSIDTLIFPFLKVSDSGRYLCVVSNAWGQDTSKSILLSVIPRFNVNYDKNNASEGETPIDSAYYYSGVKVAVLGNSGALKRKGFAFTGWDTVTYGSGAIFPAGETFIMGTRNITLYAQWKINQYDVNFDTRGGSAVAKQTVQYCAFASSPAAPTKADYTFTGWFKDSSGTKPWIFTQDTVQNDITIYAQWTTKATFAVTYDANGSTGGVLPSNPVNYEPGARVTVLGNLGMLEKTGHTFEAWNTKKDGSATSYIGGTVFNMASENITLFAKWNAIQYTVSFDSRGGSATSSQNINYGEKASAPAAPTKQGYSFTGWSKDSSGTQAWIFTRDTVFKNMALYANWTTKPTYIVKYNGNGNSTGAVPMEPANYESEAVVTVLDNSGNLAKTGYAFAGWNTTANGSGIDRAAGATFAMGTDSVTLFAQWTINHYILTYSGNGNNGGAVPAAASHDYNSVVIVSGNTGTLVKPGYAFAGWNTSAHGSDTDYAAGSTFTIGAADDTLYAKWTINQYTVAFDEQGGSAVLAQKINHGDTAVTPIAPIKPGYTFRGWFKEASGIAAWIFTNEKITSDVTIFAKWTINQYRMTYDGNGKTGGTAPEATTHDFGTTVTVPANTGMLVKAGYLFGGWNTLANGAGTNYSSGSTFAMGAADDTLFAKWNTYSYSVIFDGQDATTPANPTTKPVTSPATTVDTLPTPPKKTGYAFGGWFTVVNGGGGTEFSASTVVTSNDTVYAKWNSYSYTISYDDQSATTPVNPISKTVASPATTVGTLPIDPQKTNYRFGGWYTGNNGTGTAFAATTNVTHTMTVYAKWVRVYVVSLDAQDGSPVSTQTVDSGAYANQPTQPTRSGYAFAGWFKESACVNQWSFTGNAVNANLTLYSKWTLTVTDIDGNVYTTVTLGTQTWTVENLRTTKYNDGTNIPFVPDRATWASMTSPAYCFFNNSTDATANAKWGAIYNWYTVNTGKLVPSGWHVPTNADWDTLQNYLIANGFNYDGTTTGNKIAKSMATKTDWNSHSDPGAIGNDLTTNNKSGFSALPSGCRNTDGNFYGQTTSVGWLSATQYDFQAAWSYTIAYNTNYLHKYYYYMINGFSVRFVQNTTPPPSPPQAPSLLYAIGGDGNAVVRFNRVSGATSYNFYYQTGSSVSKATGFLISGADTGYTISGLVNGSLYSIAICAVNAGGESALSNIVHTTPLLVNDADGNQYHTVTIGTQVWTVENLKTTKFNDGSAIPLVTDSATWANLATPGYCWYNNDAATYKNTSYGAWYNWYTINTGKLAPAGWHVPTDTEWTTLTTYLGGDSVAGGKLKEAGIAHWPSPNLGATNETGFTALPGGYRNHYSTFDNLGMFGYWWSSTGSVGNAWFRIMNYDKANVEVSNNRMKEGFSVRCVRDY